MALAIVDIIAVNYAWGRSVLKGCPPVALATRTDRSDEVRADGMWNEPYLETCCRSALHRLWLSGSAGRPTGYKDGPCLVRLAGLGLAALRSDARYELTGSGIHCHHRTIQHRQAR